MARIVGGIGTSHVPSIGGAYDRGAQNEPAWKPLFDAYVPVHDWLKRLEPDTAIVVYNDHGVDFFFDKYPTFAIGCADEYPIGDEGFGVRKLPRVRGDFAFSRDLTEALVYGGFDLTVCQELAVEHGFLVPMHLCFDHDPDWPVTAVPLEVNVLQHPLPTAARCYALGKAIRRAVEAMPDERRVVILGTGGMSHQLQGKGFGRMDPGFDNDFLDRIEKDPGSLARMTHQEIMKGAGAEGVELIMWLVMRGALSAQARRVHRNYYGPMTTGMGLIAFEEP